VIILGLYSSSGVGKKSIWWISENQLSKSMEAQISIGSLETNLLKRLYIELFEIFLETAQYTVILENHRIKNRLPRAA